MAITNIDLIQQYMKSISTAGTGSKSAIINAMGNNSFENTLNKLIEQKVIDSKEKMSEINEQLVTSAELEDIFKRASEKYDVPLELLKAMAKAESNFNPDAVSRCGAMGIMQLMPATAKALGVVDAYDPEQNIMGGADYISQKLKAYDGDITLALAAYNAGSGNVAKYGGVPPFEETQNYIKKIYGYMGEDISIPDGVSTKKSAVSGISEDLGMTEETQQAYMLAQLQIIKQQLDMQNIFAGTDDDEKNGTSSALEMLERSMLINALNNL